MNLFLFLVCKQPARAKGDDRAETKRGSKLAVYGERRANPAVYPQEFSLPKYVFHIFRFMNHSATVCKIDTKCHLKKNTWLSKYDHDQQIQ